jgi:hypothetical protein
MTATLLSLLALRFDVTAVDILAASALLILIVVAIWWGWRR